MSGISDVRLTLYAQELLQDRDNGVRASVPQGLGMLALFQQRYRTRRHLLTLTQDQLRDIGLNAEQARHEGLKPFWRD